MNLRRILACAWAALVLVLLLPGSAEAHALLSESRPSEGERLSAPPDALILAFTEPPEPSLSSIAILDATGTEVVAGEGETPAADPSALRLTLPDLGQGTYTVTWRTVSKVDGHPSAGAFAFGVGVAPAETAVAVPKLETPEASPLEMAGRLILFLGLGLLIGAAWVGALAFAETPRRVRVLAATGWLASLAGVLILGLAQLRASGADLAGFLPTDVGRAVLWRAGALLIGGAALLLARRPGRVQRVALGIAGAAAAAAALAHTAAGHAAARGDMAWVKVLAQWVHLVAAAVWLGGLAALIAGIRGDPDDTKARAVARFSLVAGFALAAVVGTGVVRSVNEVGGWGPLFSTGYGVLVLVKASLLIALAGLGAVNRYRNVPRSGTSLRGLRTISRGELTLAVAATGAAAVLATLIPPAQVPAEAGPPPGITATGSDFAKSVRVRLGIYHGLPGVNHYELEAEDFDSGEPIEAQRVALRFSFLGGADVEESIAELEGHEGVFHGDGSHLSIGGPWSVTALIQQAATGTEVPLEFATVCSGLRIESTRPNEPTVTTTDTPEGGSVEGYLIHLGADRYEVHFTFIEPTGKELAVTGLPSMTAWRPGSAAQVLDPIPLTRGHFIAETELDPGFWRFDGSARSKAGSASGCFEEELG